MFQIVSEKDVPTIRKINMGETKSLDSSQAKFQKYV